MKSAASTFQNSIKAISVLAFALILGACSSSQKENSRKVAVGQDKSDVLEIMGNPSSKGRAHGFDRWIYDFENGNGGMESLYVYFDNGVVQYAGPNPKSDDKNFKDVAPKAAPAAKKPNDGFKEISP